MIPALALALAASVTSRPELGAAEGRCRPDEPGPAFLIELVGLKDRSGLVRVELYPANDQDFLADDNLLVGAGKTFRRVERPMPKAGPVELCIRAPAAGVYALAVLHDRDGNRRFSLSTDGVGFPGDPRLGWRKPHAANATARVDAGVRHLTIRINYRRGLLSFGPIGEQRP